MKTKIYYFISLLIIYVVYSPWFLPGVITGGDFWPYYKSMYPLYSFPLYAWDMNLGMGMGAFSAPLLWIFFNIGIPITFLGEFLGLHWSVIERIYYLFPLLIISIYSSITLYKKIMPKNDFSLLAAFIYTFNIYILMVIGGGQILGVAMAYALSPLILSIFIDIFDSNEIEFKKLLSLGLALSIEAIFDIRFLYITITALIIYFFITKQFRKPLKYILSLLTPLATLVLLNFFWILPTVLVNQNPIKKLGSAYSSIDAVKFFSFAKLENTISLLHPNWPENIFGKTYFMKPEFLTLPILAFSSLFFITKTKDQRTKNNLLYFAILGLIGAFLAKGAQEPFGGLYLWLFEHVPGFLMFRDPTKWYTLIAISYSILIPYSISQIYNWLKVQQKFQISNFKFQNLFILLLTSYFLLLTSPALLGELGGTFKSVQIPNEYIKLEKFISSDKKFYRTIWIPQIQRFAFFSNNHPSIPANDLFKLNSPKEDIAILKKGETLKVLQEASVKYIIVPYDSMGEIFLTDRKYDEKSYLETLKEINSIPWLKRIDGFGRIGVYEVTDPKDHFWSPQPNMKIDYKYINPTKYIVNLKNAQKNSTLVFAEGYDPGWSLRGTKNQEPRTKNYEGFNSFILPKTGNYSFEVYYTPQKWVDIGVIISLTSLVIILTGLIYLKFKKTIPNS